MFHDFSNLFSIVSNFLPPHLKENDLPGLFSKFVNSFQGEDVLSESEKKSLEDWISCIGGKDRQRYNSNFYDSLIHNEQKNKVEFIEQLKVIVIKLLNSEPGEPFQCLDDVLTFLRLTYQDKSHCSFKILGAPDLSFDSAALLSIWRILQNLISNSFKYGIDPNTRCVDITVWMHTQNDYLEVHVCDSGPGVKSDIKETMWKKGVTESASRFNSFGLGLYSCVQETKRLDGVIGYLDSEANLSVPEDAAKFQFGSLNTESKEDGCRSDGAHFIVRLPLKVPGPSQKQGCCVLA